MKIELPIIPWEVPDNIQLKGTPKSRQEGFKPSTSIALHEIDATTLSAQCDRFREEVFKKAKLIDPRTTDLPIQ